MRNDELFSRGPQIAEKLARNSGDPVDRLLKSFLIHLGGL